MLGFSQNIKILGCDCRRYVRVFKAGGESSAKKRMRSILHNKIPRRKSPDREYFDEVCKDMEWVIVGRELGAREPASLNSESFKGSELVAIFELITFDFMLIVSH